MVSAFHKVRNRDRLERIQRRMAVKVCSGYPTVSKVATLVVASAPLLPFLARLREEKHGGAEEKKALERLYDRWQE